MNRAKKLVKVGQYVRANSVIHSLDPRTKLIIIVFVLYFTILTDNFIKLSIITSFLVLIIILSRIQLNSLIFAPLRSLIYLLIFTFLIYLVSSPSEYSLTQRLYSGILYTSRLIVLVLFISILSTTTSPIDLCFGLEYLLFPLKKIRIPTQKIIFIIHLSLMFIPILFQELERLINIYASRGVNFKKGNILNRIRRLIPIMILLFKISFHRADELALVLESRGYQLHKNRTKLKELKMTAKDYLLIVIGIVLMIFWLVI